MSFTPSKRTGPRSSSSCRSTAKSGVTCGALLSSKLNLLGTYEGLRIIQGSTLVSHVPDPAMKRGDFSALATQLRDPVSGLPLEANRIPESRIHPVAKRLLPLIPD